MARLPVRGWQAEGWAGEDREHQLGSRQRPEGTAATAAEAVLCAADTGSCLPLFLHSSPGGAVWETYGCVRARAACLSVW